MCLYFSSLRTFLSIIYQLGFCYYYSYIKRAMISDVPIEMLAVQKIRHIIVKGNGAAISDNL